MHEPDLEEFLAQWPEEKAAALRAAQKAAYEADSLVRDLSNARDKDFRAWRHWREVAKMKADGWREVGQADGLVTLARLHRSRSDQADVKVLPRTFHSFSGLVRLADGGEVGKRVGRLGPKVDPALLREALAADLDARAKPA